MKPKDLIVGTWISIDDTSSVEIRVRKKKTYTVTAIDSFDGEVASVAEVKRDSKTGILSFAAYWDSSGRFTRYRMMHASEDKIDITYTHTDSEVLIRKKTPNQSSQPTPPSRRG
jgi:hypothetical protein